MSRNRTNIIIAAAVVIVVVALGLLLAPSGQNAEEFLDLGNRYLSELRNVQFDNIGLTDLSILEKCPKLDSVSV